MNLLNRIKFYKPSPSSRHLSKITGVPSLTASQTDIIQIQMSKKRKRKKVDVIAFTKSKHDKASLEYVMSSWLFSESYTRNIRKKPKNIGKNVFCK